MARHGGFTALLAKDARVEARGKHALLAGLVLVALFLVLDLFAFRTLRGEVRAAAMALWTPILFATVALGGRGLANEADRGTLALLRSAPVPSLAIGASRTLVNLAVAAGLAALATALGALLFGIPLNGTLAATLALGVLGLGVLATLASALAAHAGARETLLPLLVVPVAAPLLQAGLHATIAALEGARLADVSPSLLAMAGYDLLLLAASVALWPVLLDE